jgi:primosomal protein N' (replication factor Y)
MPTKAVLVPYPVDRAYDYDAPEDMGIEDGDYVLVPLGPRSVPGVVWGEGGADKVAASKIKSILTKFDLPPMPEEMRKFLEWAAHYTMSDLGAFLKLSLSVPAALEPVAKVRMFRALFPISPSPNPLPAGERAFNDPNEAPSPLRGEGRGEGGKISPAAKRVLDIAADGLARKASELAREAGCGAGVIKTLADKHLLEEVFIEEPPPGRNPDLNLKGATLSTAQKKMADILCAAFSPPCPPVNGGDKDSPVNGRDKGGERTAPKPILLDGVTGSGKTEVYFEAVAAALKDNKQVLILLPEIALSNAFLSRFQDRFGCAPALWHSSLSDSMRKITWRGVASGQSRVVIGARSALFLPYKELGLIIVDEEHDPAYKQEEGVIYHARDMAVARAHMGKFPVVLVSATPSLETMQNVWMGKYGHLHLPDRHGGAGLPDVHIIDMTKDKPEKNQFIAPSLAMAMTETIGGGGQVLLFLNRRGYAPLTLCRTCGFRFECPRCSAWLIAHKKTNHLHCHHCGYQTRMPETCPTCGDADSLVACGPGVERIMEEVKERFPEARTVILSSDTADTHEKLAALLDDIREHRIDIIIGTQIIAKGHHFPKLTCVGIIDADLGLAGGDLRAGERTFQLLHQVAGRAGREAEKGHVYLQTYHREARVMLALASHNRDDFLEVEASQREAAKMPPYSRLAGIIVSGRDEEQVLEVSKLLGQSAPYGPGVQTLGPADAPLYRLRGKFRRRLLVRADKTLDMQKAISHWLSGVKIPSAVRVQVDIDPQSFF